MQTKIILGILVTVVLIGAFMLLQKNNDSEMNQVRGHQDTLEPYEISPGDVTEKIENGEVHPVIDELKYKMRLQGWKLVAKPYIWYKSQAMPHNCKYRAIDRYEYVFHFSNTITPKIYPDNCRTQYADVTLRRYKNPIPTLNSRDGVLQYKDSHASEKGSLPHNVIEAPAESNPNILHPAPFSVKLVDWFVRFGSDIGGVVMDPFAGSSTTGIAAIMNDRKYIGLDLMEFNVEFGKKRLSHFEKTGDLYIPKKSMDDYSIDYNYYRLKGKHVNNP